MREENPRLFLDGNQVSLAFDLAVAPNHKGHIGPGTYRLDITVTADNSLPMKRVVGLVISGPCFGDEERMFEDGLSVSVSTK